jgi:hypothetical protein
MKIKLTAQPNISKYIWSVQFKVSWAGSDAQWNTVNANPVSAAKLEITAGAEISVANSAATSTAEIAGNNAELVKFTATVKNGSKQLDTVTVAQGTNKLGTTSNPVDVELTIDWKSTYQSTATGSDIIFSDINETLEIGKHDFVVKANIPDDGAAVLVDVASVNPGKDTKVNVKKIFVKAYPVLSNPSVNNNSSELVFTINNPSGSEDINVKWFVFADEANVQTISMNWTTYALSQLDADTTDHTLTLKAAESPVIIGSNSSIEWRIQVKTTTAGTQAILQGIIVSVDGNPDYILTKDYSNVAGNKWADYKVTYKTN